MTDTLQRDELVALDLEGTGAQDGDAEAILEIAIVPVRHGRPALDDGYTTLINPGRPIPRRPWISPGLNDRALAAAPTLAEVEPELTARLNGKIIIGHNVGVDWRLLHRRCPHIRPAGLIDTLRLARHVHPAHRAHGLQDLLRAQNLTEAVNRLAKTSRPHRALWDTIAAAVLLTHLTDTLPAREPRSLHHLRSIAGLTIDPGHTPCAEQESLWD